MLALDPETGRLKWYFQFSKHDDHDYDATQVPVIVDQGERHLILQANRNGFFYVIDRTSGKLLFANPFAKVTWSDSKDASGAPIARKDASPTLEGNRVCPGAAGATNWMSPTYDPQTQLFYDAAPFTGALRALDPNSGKIKWEWKHPSPTWSGVLSTAGGLVFTGDAEGNFIALEAASGKALWHFQCGASVYSSPMSFAIDGKQYVAVAAGSALFTFALP